MQPGSTAAGAPFRDPVVRLTLQEITKAFPGVVANDRITLEIRPGEIHALLGENGAGKTTLMNILYGIYQPDAGVILLNDRPVRIRSPRDAITLGIGMVPQHFLLVRRHTAAENVALALPTTPLLLPLRAVARRIRTYGARYGLDVNPDAYIWQLSVSEQQRVEILKALLRGARVLILDEPTSVLTPQEATRLFAVLRQMRDEGHTVIFITHKLDEVMAVADRVTVLRKGRVVATLERAGVTPRSLATLMVGREIEMPLPARSRPGEDHALGVEDLWALNDRGLPALRGVSFTVRRGEIVGIAGVAGNGQREQVEVLAGLRPRSRGRVEMLGRDVTGQSARRLFDAGLAHIPEERIRMGIVPGMTVAENLVLKHYRLAPFSRGPLLDAAAVARFAQRMIVEFDIASPGVRVAARLLSGGNIQKLILARELAHRPGLILAAHPTAGLDVGATAQIHNLLLRGRDGGAGVLLVSEDLEEVLALSDRIAVMFGGRIMGIVPPTVSREALGLMMAGQPA